MNSTRTAVVTGSSKGWGRLTAEGLAADGVQVVVNGRSDDVGAVVDKIRSQGGKAIGVRVSADTAAGVEELTRRALEAFGAIDIWVNALGTRGPAPLLELEEENWDDHIRVQLKSVYLGARAAARQMVSQGRGGRIITVVGGTAFGAPNLSHYAATKGGSLSATYSWAAELKEHGITVNAIRGSVQSPGVRVYLDRVGLYDENAAIDDDKWRELGFQTPESAMPLPVWLASEETADLTGIYIGIDASRIVVYDRVSLALEMFQEPLWTPETLEEQLHPALRELPSFDDPETVSRALASSVAGDWKRRSEVS